VTQVTGRRFTFQQVPLDALPAGMRALCDWLDRVGHQVDLAALHHRFASVGWHRFPAWAATREWPGDP
jgi:hypothetical protein